MPHRRRLPHTDNPRSHRRRSRPSSACNMSVARALSTAWCVSSISRGAHFDPASRRCWPSRDAARIRTWPTMPLEQFSAEVRVTLNDGRRLSRRVDDMAGRGGDHPMSSEELWEKFGDCARAACPEQDHAAVRTTRDAGEGVFDTRCDAAPRGGDAPCTACGYGAGQVRQGLRARGGRDDLGPPKASRAPRERSNHIEPQRLADKAGSGGNDAKIKPLRSFSS